jgi:hypothetical protein
MEIKNTCVICYEEPVVPTKLNTSGCGCWKNNLVCLTCAYSAMNLNKKEKKLRCFCCNTDIDHKHASKSTDYYVVQKDLMGDEMVNCPYECGAKVVHSECQKHLRKDCPKAENYRCRGCKCSFTKNEYINHVIANRPTNAFCRDELICSFCRIVFKTHKQYKNHFDQNSHTMTL